MEEAATTPIANILIHNAVFWLSFIAFIVSVIAWYKMRGSGKPIEEYWTMFVFGLFFYTISEFSDLFTPGLRASLGMHNYFTELALLVGLAFIFIGMRRLILSTGEDKKNT